MYLGIDPGVKGAFALIGREGELIECKIFPTVKELSKSGRKMNRTDIKELSNFMKFVQSYHGVSHIMIEEPLLMPGQHVSSTFYNGVSHGIITAILELCFPGVEVHKVKCKDWQDEMIIDRTFVTSKVRRDRRKQLKADSVRTAQELYPSFDFKKSKKSKVDSDGMADAVLIARYCYEHYGEIS